MHRRLIVPLMLVAALALAACGGGSSKAGSATSTTVLKLSSSSWETAKPNPSISARMICQTEVRGEIAQALEITETRVVPTWSKKQHLYSCTYVYPRGKIVLSVKEMSNERETTAYFDAVKNKFGVKQTIVGLAQGAWVLKNDDVVARKDYKVLLVDVHAIPADFVHQLVRSGVAQSIATVIMACWTGA
jgi:hypothetical protein